MKNNNVKILFYNIEFTTKIKNKKEDRIESVPFKDVLKLCDYITAQREENITDNDTKYRKSLIKLRHIKVSSDKIAWLNTYNKINENLATGYFITGKSGYSPDLIDVSTFQYKKK